MNDHHIVDDTETWGRQNQEGRAKASRLITRMLETGDVTALLGECRKLGEDPFYSGVGVGFFTCIAAYIVSE